MNADEASLLEDLHRQLREQLAEFPTGDQWLAYLDGARQFHRYSPGNQLLLMLQGARGHVASYRTWQRIPAVDGGHCQVRRGEHHLKILAPIRVASRGIDDITGDEIVVGGAVRGFKPVKVFHQGQLVSSPAIAERPMPTLLTGPDRWQHIWASVVDQLGDEGYPVQLHTASPGETWNGRTHFVDGYIEVMDHLQPPQRVKTVLHEWAHVALHHDTTVLSRPVQEIEAESVAYLLGRTIGLDTTVYSLPYLAGWADGDADLAAATAQRVLATTAECVDILDARLDVELCPDLYRAAGSTAPPIPLHPRWTPTLPAGRDHPTMAASPEQASRSGVIAIDRDRAPNVAAPAALQPVLDRLLAWDQRVLVDAVGRFPAGAGYDAATALCADAGADAATTAAALCAVGADPVRLRKAMKQPVVDPDGSRHFLFDDIDAAFRVGSPPRWLEPDDVTLFEQLVDVDDPERVRRAAAALHTEGGHRRGEILEVLTYLGVADEDASRIVDDVLGPSPAVAPPAQPRPGPVGSVEPDSGGSATGALLRRVVDDGADAARVAALATGLGLSHQDTIAACARLGLDESFVASVAVERRQGDIGAARRDLAAGWGAVPPTEGWDRHLDDGSRSTTPSLSPEDVPPVADATIKAILLQWQQASSGAPAPAVP